MAKKVHLKFFSWVLLVVVMTVTMHGVHNCAHAMQGHQTSAMVAVSSLEISASHQSPCSPLSPHDDYDDCESCLNCACHAQLTIHPFQLSYNPSIIDFGTSEEFKHLPEVYLPKFIPPQNLA